MTSFCQTDCSKLLALLTYIIHVDNIEICDVILVYFDFPYTTSIFQYRFRILQIEEIQSLEGIFQNLQIYW